VGSAVGSALIVAALWLSFGGGGGGSVVSGLEEDPGIPPPAYVYLDNAQILSYLGQIEGGLSDEEKQTTGVTSGKNAGFASSGFQVGATVGSSASVERTVTPTAASRFYRLLDRLRAKGYLRSIDMRAPAAKLRKRFAGVSEGTFVRLTNCSLQIPTYVRFERLLRAPPQHVPVAIPRGHGAATAKAVRLRPGELAIVDAWDVLRGVEAFGVTTDSAALNIAEQEAAGAKRIVPIVGMVGPPPAAQFAALDAASTALVKAAGPDPRVPLSTCDGGTSPIPRGVDLLFPIQIGAISPEQSLLAGPVTLVGKVVRVVRTKADAYVDDASMTVFGDPLDAIDEATNGEATAFGNELDADASVLAPGAVILPIAIYK